MFKTTLILLAVSAGAGAQGQDKQGKAPAPPPLKLTIPAFADGGEIPRKHTCFEPEGSVSPAVKWTNVPPGTVSFALILHEPELGLRKSAEDVVHWILWNIPGTSAELPEDLPRQYDVGNNGRQGNTINMRPGYYPLCPPFNPHHFMFELYALDKTVDLPPGAGRTELLKEIAGHVVGKAVYVGLAHR